jgi:23S rRNA pseudouridine2604 synthase
MDPENDDRVSLNKVVSGSGFCSRREADNYIETGRVTINNKVARKGAWVKPGDVVAIDGEKIKSVKKNAAIYIALNKPVGITSTTDPKDKSNIIDYINYRTRIFPVGRLDKDSDGLIILTNDGDIVNKILRASNNHEKEYIVTVDKPVDEAFVRRMSEGVEILDEVTKKCYVRAEGARRFRIVLTQGLNRQIRRMCEALGYKVHTLTRVRIMNISLDGLGVGKWRYFSASEIEKMNEIIAGSHNTDQELPKRKANAKAKIQKAKEERVAKVEEHEEPTQPFDEYEVVRPTKKRKTGNQWWSNNINQKQKKEKPELEAFPETTKPPARTKGLVRNKKAAAGGKPFNRSAKPVGKKANAKGKSAKAKPFNRKEKPSRGRR